MIRKFMSLPFILFVMACVPITPEPATLASPTPEPTPTPGSYSDSGTMPRLASENYSDCPNATADDVAAIQEAYGFLALKAGESADDPVAINIPGYIDIVRVETALDGEILTATLHLRELPEQLEFSRKGAASDSPEYMWMIHIDTDMIEEPELERFEYMFGAFAMMNIGMTSGKSFFSPLEEGLQVTLWKTRSPDRLDSVPTDPSMSISHELNTISLTGEISGISPSSDLTFYATDMLLDAHDGVSCLPE
ncbi:MAG: hypothetical protein OXI52_01690 [Caldilineaceae bacterium]|nr:hypothetical protein [Caldilineaceae bacterium]